MICLALEGLLKINFQTEKYSIYGETSSCGRWEQIQRPTTRVRPWNSQPYEECPHQISLVRDQGHWQKRRLKQCASQRGWRTPRNATSTGSVCTRTLRDRDDLNGRVCTRWHPRAKRESGQVPPPLSQRCLQQTTSCNENLVSLKGVSLGKANYS